MTVDWTAVPSVTLDAMKIPPEVEMKAGLPNNKGRPSLTGPGKLERVDLNPYRSGYRLQQIVFDIAADLTRDYAGQPGCEAPAHVLFPQLGRIVERFLAEHVHPLPPASVLDVALSAYYGWVIEALVGAIGPATSEGEAPELPRYETRRGLAHTRRGRLLDQPRTTSPAGLWVGSALRARVWGSPWLEVQPGCPGLRFAYGLQVRPFFASLSRSRPNASRMATAGIDRQILSAWTDIFGYGLPAAARRRLAPAAERVARRALPASPRPLLHARVGSSPRCRASGARVEDAVRLGAVGAVAATNVEGTNLGELPLDEYWAAAVGRPRGAGVPASAQPNPTPRTRRFALNQIVQYTFDTTLAVGSLISNGVLDRFPALTLILAHGGGAVPYLIGRLTACMGGATARDGIAAASPPSGYLRRMYYDTLLHDAQALRYLASRVTVDRLLIGSDDSFPPADHDPLGSLRRADFSHEEIHRIGELNPRAIFRVGDPAPSRRPDHHGGQQHRPGKETMDDPRYSTYSAITDRPRLRWPVTPGVRRRGGRPWSAASNSVRFCWTPTWT